MVKLSPKFFFVFPALQSINYRLYFCGQMISLIGTWMQIVAQGWLVLKLTNSAFWVGLVAASVSLPTLLFSLFGGLIVDSYPKRKIIFFTQISSMVLALILGLLTIFQVINIWEILVLAFLLGIVNAIDIPARQSFVIEVVGKENLASAISLNSGLFNGARVIGPTIAGILIGTIGIGGAFLINGISYIAVIIALSLMKVSDITRKKHADPIKAIKEGIKFAYDHPIIRTLLIFTGISSIFGWSYTTIMPVIAQNVYNIGAVGLGYLYAAIGVGAVSATITVSAFSKKISPVIFILGGNALFSVAVVLFTLSENLFLALFFLSLSGFGLLSMFSMINTTIQQMVEDRYRGRVMALYAVMFLGMTPLGSLQVGFLTEQFGPGFAIRLGALITFLFGLLVFMYRDRIRRSHAIYEQERNII